MQKIYQQGNTVKKNKKENRRKLKKPNFTNRSKKCIN